MKKKARNFIFRESKLTSAISSSPMTPNGTIVAPNLAAILTNSGWSGQNNLYISPWEIERNCEITHENNTAKGSHQTSTCFSANKRNSDYNSHQQIVAGDHS